MLWKMTSGQRLAEGPDRTFEFELQAGAMKVVQIFEHADHLAILVQVGSDEGVLLREERLSLPNPIGYTSKARGEVVLVDVRSSAWLPFLYRRYRV